MRITNKVVVVFVLLLTAAGCDTDAKDWYLAGNAVNARLPELDGTDVRNLRIENARLTAKHLNMLCEVSSIRQLILKDVHLPETGIEAIGRLKAIDDLQLIDSEVPPNCLTSIANIRELKSLRVAGSVISKSEFSALGQLSGLESIAIGDGQLYNVGSLTDAHIAFLEGLTQLTSVTIAGRNITDDGLIVLNKLPNVTTLSVASESVSGRFLADLDLPQYYDLRLVMPIEKRYASLLSGCSRLVRLDLSRTPLEDSSLESLQSLPWLQWLVPSRTMNNPKLTAFHDSLLANRRRVRESGVDVPTHNMLRIQGSGKQIQTSLYPADFEYPSGERIALPSVGIVNEPEVDQLGKAAIWTLNDGS
ncbi:hypothetical protein ACFL2H_10575, partial [Planctomycetota bacterium]